MATKEEELKGQKRNLWLQDSVVSLTHSLPVLLPISTKAVPQNKRAVKMPKKEYCFSHQSTLSFIF